jgi:hypothetical protein
MLAKLRVLRPPLPWRLYPGAGWFLTSKSWFRQPGRVVLAGQGEPPFAVEALLELGPLSQEDLSGLPGAFEATGGLPVLVAAWLRGEPLEAALEARLWALSEEARQVYMALALSNLAELEGDLEVWQEAIAVSENAGYLDLAQQQREQLRAFMERSG